MKGRLSVLAILVALPCPGAQREATINRHFAATPGKVVVIDAGDVDVSVRAADVRELQITTELSISGVGEERAEQWISSHTPQYQDSEQQLVVTVQPGKQGSPGFGLGLLTARAHLRVVLPAWVVPDLTTTSGHLQVWGDFPDARPLRLRTATGDMELGGAAASIDVRSTSGDTRIDLVRPLEHFFARTSSGHISLTGGARTVNVDTASGNIWLSNLSGSVDAYSSTGKLTLRWDRLDPGSTVKAHSASSRILLSLPETCRPQGVLRTVSGTVRSDFPGQVNDAGDTVQLDGDGPDLDVESASGQIIVGFADALAENDGAGLRSLLNRQPAGNR